MIDDPATKRVDGVRNISLNLVIETKMNLCGKDHQTRYAVKHSLQNT